MRNYADVPRVKSNVQHGTKRDIQINTARLESKPEPGYFFKSVVGARAVQNCPNPGELWNMAMTNARCDHLFLMW